MRIKQITVTHLFGIFDTIHLNREERITIIYGKNGFGKTSILRLVNGFFHLKYSVLLDLTHKVFRISKESLAYYLPKNLQYLPLLWQLRYILLRIDPKFLYFGCLFYLANWDLIAFFVLRYLILNLCLSAVPSKH